MCEGKITDKKVSSFGNRCGRCGGHIDEGGICPCGYDHSAGVDLKASETSK